MVTEDTLSVAMNRRTSEEGRITTPPGHCVRTRGVMGELRLEA